MFPVWTSVICSNADHPRFGMAGHVSATNATEFPDLAVVTFDLDGTAESMPLADLKAL